MPVANHSRVRLFARKRTNECNANAMHICERQIYECMRWDNAHFNAHWWMVCGPHTLPPRGSFCNKLKNGNVSGGRIASVALFEIRRFIN